MIIRVRRYFVSYFRPGDRSSRFVFVLLFLLFLPAWASPTSAADDRDVSILDPSGFRDWIRSGRSLQAPLESILAFTAEDQVFRFLDNNVANRSIPLFQVVPLEGGISAAHFANWRSSLPVAARKEGAFALDNGVIRGEGEFGWIRVGPVTLPEGWPKHPVLVVDAGFFIPLYKDEVRTPMVPLVMKLVATLRNASVRWDSARIINRNSDPNFPLEFGYISELLREVLSDPEAFRDEIPERWALLDRAQYLAFFGQEEEAMREYGTLVGMGSPAAVRYQAATLAFRGEGNFRDGIRYLEEAAKKDKAYSRGFLVQGTVFWDRGDLPAAEQILRAGLKIFPGDERMKIGLARNLAEQAVSVRKEDPVSAERMIREALSLPVPEEVRGEILDGWGDAPVIPIAPSRPADGRKERKGQGH